MQCMANLQSDVAALQSANAMLHARIEQVVEQATVAQQHYQQLRV